MASRDQAAAPRHASIEPDAAEETRHDEAKGRKDVTCVGGRGSRKEKGEEEGEEIEEEGELEGGEDREEEGEEKGEEN